MITRRGFLLGTAAAAAAIIVPELEVPKKTIFLPPPGGWTNTDGFYKRYIGYDELMVTAPVHPKYGAQTVFLQPGHGDSTVCMPREAEIGRIVTVHNLANGRARILEGVTLEPGESAMVVKVDKNGWRAFKSGSNGISKPVDG